MAETQHWITNAHDAGRAISELCRGSPGRCLIVGAPKPTEHYGVAELEGKGMVGIYEVRQMPAREG